MGGYGSGYRGLKTLAIEDCLTLSMPNLMRAQAIVTGAIRSGTWCWSYAGQPPHAQISYVADLQDPDNASLRLLYTVNGRAMDYTVALVTSGPHYGGRRWWFLCPLAVENGRSPIRAAKLHLPPGGRYFASRQIYRLTYRSCQQSGQHRGLYRLLAARMGTDARTISRVLKDDRKRRRRC